MTGPKLRPDLAELTGYHSPEVDVDVRLNTNESPYAPPAAFVEELAVALRTLPYNRYPDRRVVELRAALGDFLGLGADSVFCASGSNEVIQTLLLSFGGPTRRVLIFGPTYTMHTHIAEITGTPCVSVQRDPDFGVSPASAQAAIEAHEPDIVFFCHPNNPTGTPESRSAVEVAAADTERLVILDEAYVDFAEASMVDIAQSRPNVAVCRTMSKAWSMPALRIGYVVAAPQLVKKLGAAHLPYHLDAIAQIAGRLALGFRDDMRARVAAILRERARLEGELASRGDVRLWPSQANFVLISPDDGGRASADAVWEGLVGHRVLVRNASSWPGTEGCLRVTVGTPSENDRFLDAFDQTMTVLRAG